MFFWWIVLILHKWFRLIHFSFCQLRSIFHCFEINNSMYCILQFGLIISLWFLYIHIFQFKNNQLKLKVMFEFLKRNQWILRILKKSKYSLMNVLFYFIILFKSWYRLALKAIESSICFSMENNFPNNFQTNRLKWPMGVDEWMDCAVQFPSSFKFEKNPAAG